MAQLQQSQRKRFSLPRFALNESYGDIDRFKLISQTLASAIMP